MFFSFAISSLPRLSAQPSARSDIILVFFFSFFFFSFQIPAVANVDA